MRAGRVLFPVLGFVALVATACPEQPGGGGPATTTTLADNDGDGYTTGTDCNDSNPAINPGQTVDTVGDGVDSNCDGQDGIETNTVFVSALGGDTSTCGDVTEPCESIDHGSPRRPKWPTSRWWALPPAPARPPTE